MLLFFQPILSPHCTFFCLLKLHFGMPAVEMCILFFYFFKEFRQTKQSVWFQAHGQMATQNAPSTALTKHTRVSSFIVCVFHDASTIYSRQSRSAAFSANCLFFCPSPLSIADNVTIKSNQYLISNIVLLQPVSF